MKKILVLMMVLAMALCLVACGGEESAGEGNAENNGAEQPAAAGVDLEKEYGIDLDGEGEQKLSDERAAADVLLETKDVWLEGKMTFAFDENPKTYDDLAEHIGCDASFYTYSAADGERQFVWVADGDETAKLIAVFWETPDGWTLYSIGSANIG